MNSTTGDEFATVGAWPTIPEGWRLDYVNHRTDESYVVHIATGKGETYDYRLATGPTPQAALAAAIAAAQEAGE